MKKGPFSTVLENAWIDLHDPQVVWQIAILLGCFLLAWGAGRALRLSRVEADGIWKFGVGGLRRAPLLGEAASSDTAEVPP